MQMFDAPEGFDPTICSTDDGLWRLTKHGLLGLRIVIRPRDFEQARLPLGFRIFHAAPRRGTYFSALWAASRSPFCGPIGGEDGVFLRMCRERSQFMLTQPHSAGPKTIFDGHPCQC